jgi:DNA-directed RNA polymerase specialized sigma24 family protein
VPGETAPLDNVAWAASRFANPKEAARPAGLEPSYWDWEDLYSRLGPGLVVLGARRFGLSREDAEEALQMAATAIVLAAPSVRSPEAYLTSVFLRECLGILRKRSQLARTEVAQPIGFDAADDSCERIEVACRFRQAFSLLSPVCRSMMRSCLLDGRRRADADSSIAARTVYKRYRKCLRTLAHALG